MTVSRQRAAALALRPLLLVVVALIVLRFRLGPVVLTVSPTHGVHLGDAFALLPGLVAVLPHRRLRLDRRVGVVTPLAPLPMRRATDRGVEPV
ncbi:MAG: hypothetical protein JWN57_296 [Frankiales bacterium]|jgi:hypothetical protein|nr:hypothetical protein [Frankiales bacterium]